MSLSGTLDLKGFNQQVAAITGSGTVTNTGAAGATFTINNAAADTFAGLITNGAKPLALIKSGAGALTLSHANSYTGTTTISAGLLNISSDGNLGAAPSVPTPAALTISGGALGITSAFALDANRGISTGSGAGGTISAGAQLTVPGAISGSAGLTKTGAATLILTGANTYVAMTISAGTVQVGSGGTTGSLGTGAVSVGSGATLAFDLSSSTEVANAINGAGSLTQIGSGTLTLTGANGYTGTTTISAGALQVGNGGSAGKLGTGAVTDNAVLIFNVSSSNTVANQIGGSGSLFQAGAGTTTLSGANSYKGGTTINAGVLKIAADNNLGAAPATATPGSLTMNGGILATTASFTLNANRGLSLGASGGAIDVATSKTLSYGGVIAGAGSLTKINQGTLALSGTSSHTGATTVQAGTMLVNGVQAGSALGVAVGAVLGGANGTVGPLGVAGGTLSPGAAAAGTGILNSGTALFSSTAAFNVNLNGTSAGSSYDQLNVTGAVDLGTATALNVTLGYSPVIGDTFTILNNNLADAVVGAFAGLPEGGTLSLGQVVFQITYLGDTGNDIVLTCIDSGTTIPTLTSIGSPQTSSIYGQVVLFTATVAGIVTSSVAPTGTVAFLDGSIVLDTVPVSTADGVTTATLSTAALTAATHTQIVAQYSGDDNYDPSTSPSFTFTVDKAALTITAGSTSKIYGDELAFAGTEFTSSGLVNDDSVESVAFASAGAAASATVADSDYAITASDAMGSGLDNYTIAYVDGALAVTPAPLTITANDISKTYGDSLVFDGTEFTTSGLVNDDTVASLTLASSGAAPTATVAGSAYAILATGAVGTGLDNYAVTFVAGHLTVTPATLVITPNNLAKLYGAAVPSLSVSYDGFVNGESAADLTAQPTLSTTADATSHVDDYDITASGAVGANYAISYETGTLSVTPAALTITADDQSKVYGDAVPVLTVTYSGFVNGDTAASLNTLPTLSTTATAASNVAGGPYDITASGAVAADYDIDYVDGSLTVTPRALTVSISGGNKVYDTTTAAPVTLSDNHLGSDVVILSYTSATFANKNAGSGKTVSVSGISIGGADASNYTLQNTSGTTTATITPAPLTVSISGGSKVYDTTTGAVVTLSDNHLGSDVVVDSYTSASFANKNAGTGKTISVSGITISGVDASNYTLQNTSGTTTATITPAPLTISISGGSKIYDGAAAATVTLSDNHLGGDVIVDSYTSAAFADKNAGAGKTVTVSGITISGADAGNYALQNVTGTATATITPAPLTVTANDATRFQGSDNPTFTVTFSAFVNGEGPSSLGGTLTFTTPATTSSPTGPYPIIPSGLSSTNYAIAFANGVLTITPAPGKISGHVYQDLTGNGMSSDDVGLAGITVYIDGNNNCVLNNGEATAVTDTSGAYIFLGLTPGTYVVREVLPTGYVRTGPAVADNYSAAVSNGVNAAGIDFDNFQLLPTNVISNVRYTIDTTWNSWRPLVNRGSQPTWYSTSSPTDLRGRTNQGDLVQVTFTVAANVASFPVSLVSYTARPPRAMPPPRHSCKSSILPPALSQRARIP